MTGEPSKWTKFKNFVKKHPFLFTFLVLGILAAAFFTGGLIALPFILPVVIQSLGPAALALYLGVGLMLLGPLAAGIYAKIKRTEESHQDAKNFTRFSALYGFAVGTLSLLNPLAGFIVFAIFAVPAGLVGIYKG